MIAVALQFLRDEVNSWLASRTSVPSSAVALSRVVDENGRYAFAEDTVALSLVCFEEERVLRGQAPEYTLKGGQHVMVQPELAVNLTVMFASNHRNYDQALKHLSSILTFFQAQARFTHETHPALDARIDRLLVELLTLTYEQQSHIWTIIGGKMLPNALYRVRLLPLRDDAPVQVQPPVVEVQATAQAS